MEFRSEKDTLYTYKDKTNIGQFIHRKFLVTLESFPILTYSELTLLDYGKLPQLQESIRKEVSSTVAEYAWEYELTLSLPVAYSVLFTANFLFKAS